MSRPRILVDALAVKEGGSVSYLINMLREIGRDDRGLDFTFVAPAGELADLDWHGQSVVWLQLPPGPLRLPARVLYEQLVLPLRARRYDLLYCMADQSPCWGRTPVVVLMKNLNIYDRRYYRGVRTWILSWLVGRSARRARFNVFPSRAAADAITTAVTGIRSERAVVVHYGIDTAAFDSTSPPVPSDAPYLFLAAAPERHKGIHTLIASLSHFEGEAPEAWIAGDSTLDPNYLAELEDLARREGVSDRVRFLGRVPYRNLLGYYRGARAMVFPSQLESFGHPLLEAMAGGVPIVASDIPVFRELGEGVALFFPPGDPEALARAVEGLARNPQATAERVARGLRAAEQEYTWRRSIDGICRVFRHALEQA